MDFRRIFMLFAAGIFFLTTSTFETHAQAGKLYEDMSRAERLVFVGQQARRIAREMSGSEYEFTPEFESDIQKIVTQYAQRIGDRDRSGKTDLRLVLERGRTHAPTIIAAFKARNVSPLIGLYLPWIESEYVNIEPPNPTGPVGMFQFLPSTGQHLGLSVQDLLDVGKSADAAARYIMHSLDTFKANPMKEALALLSYTEGTPKTARDLKVLLNDQNKRCSICALTTGRGSENSFYVQAFFAAAIIGENPHVFGLQTQPLSSH